MKEGGEREREREGGGERERERERERKSLMHHTKIINILHFIHTFIPCATSTIAHPQVHKTRHSVPHPHNLITKTIQVSGKGRNCL